MYRTLLSAAALMAAAVMLGFVGAHLFFGATLEHATAGFAAGFAGITTIVMLHNRCTCGMWIKRPSAHEVDLQGHGARRGYFIGSIAVLPVALAMMTLGFDRNVVTTVSVLVSGFIAAAYFMRARRALTVRSR
jgi:hypothetical protein